MCYSIVKKEGDIMPKFHKIKLALAFISLFALISLVQETYSKYSASAIADVSMSIARWQITINNQDIIENSYITNTIVPTIISNDHVKEGVLAPRSVGYYDLVIDYTNVDTSFEYTIITSVPEASGVSDLKVTGYSENGGSIIPVNGEISNLNNTILYSESTRVKSLRIYITWEDSEEEQMNNAADTNAALGNKKAMINTLINFKQITD